MHVTEWRRREEAVPEPGLKGTRIVRTSVPDTCQCDWCSGDYPYCNRSEIQISHELCNKQSRLKGSKSGRCSSSLTRVHCMGRRLSGWIQCRQVLCRYSLKTDLYKANSQLIKVRNEVEERHSYSFRFHSQHFNHISELRLWLYKSRHIKICYFEESFFFKRQ